MNLNWSKIGTNYSLTNAQVFMNRQYPNEEHGIAGDCINPKCDYRFTDEDTQEIESNSGWFACPKCGWSYNYLDETQGGKPGGYTRSGLTMSEMGLLGEEIVGSMQNVPGVGQVTQTFDYHFPIDAIIGPYGVEIKTNHSEAQPRFKIGGQWITDPDTGKRMPAREGKTLYCQRNGLRPAMIGVRLNFYTDKADVFFREEFKDTWIGSGNLQHIGTVDFSDLNPFKDPSDVPPPSELPDDDSDIPF